VAQKASPKNFYDNNNNNMAVLCRKFGGEVVHVGILALQAKGISCFGWEVRQKLRVLEYL